jgi:hypothetical protein
VKNVNARRFGDVRLETQAEPEGLHFGERGSTRKAISPKRWARPILPGNEPTADAAWFAVQVTKKYPQLSKADKHRVLATIKTALPPKASAGRPRREDVTEAMRLEADGVKRLEIYCRLGKITRDQQHALREAMRQRRARTRKRDKSAPVTPTIPAPVLSI